jgi:cytochrome c oxidase accessory protein FixG
MDDGRRHLPIVTADVHGRFARARTIVFVVLIALLATLPHLRIHGGPLMALDIPARRFILLGAAFNAQDTWLLFFVLTGVGFSLLVATALVGRGWCAWMCPQTVFLEGVFRRIERLVEGSRSDRIHRAGDAHRFQRTVRGLVKHGLYIAASLAVSYIFLGYFVFSSRTPVLIGLAIVLYGDFAFFRHQVCAFVCPYGRLQSVLLDDNSLIVGYDAKRGEPRRKGAAKSALATSERTSDCVDCDRCVVVCPAGIDIRDGLQLECIACTACIDACDTVMLKLGRPPGLVRYDSLNGFAGKPSRILRPRVFLYAVLLVCGATAAFAAARSRVDIGLSVLRLPGAPYSVDAGSLHNGFDLHVVNKSASRRTFSVQADAGAPMTAIVSMPSVTLPPWGDAHVPLFVSMPSQAYTGDLSVAVQVQSDDGSKATGSAPFLGARMPP